MLPMYFIRIFFWYLYPTCSDRYQPISLLSDPIHLIHLSCTIILFFILSYFLYTGKLVVMIPVLFNNLNTYYLIIIKLVIFIENHFKIYIILVDYIIF